MAVTSMKFDIETYMKLSFPILLILLHNRSLKVNRNTIYLFIPMINSNSMIISLVHMSELHKKFLKCKCSYKTDVNVV